MANEAGGNLSRVKQALEPTIEETRQPRPFSEWYMVVVRPNHEQQAADSFRRANVRAYWPNYEHFQTVRDRGNKPRRIMVLSGIMPGYVFSPRSPMQDFGTLIERIVGVVKIVRTFSGDPLLLKESDIHTIRRIEAGLNTPSPAKSIHNFKTGEKVRFIDDLLGRWPPGRISKVARNGRISAEVELMGRKVTAIILPHQIERF
ncbi:MAG: transcription termination/antitermination protein NusG [Rhizomicrobium sp.]